MPRPPRVEFAGAFYHLMNRGDHLEAIFSDHQDRELFLKTLDETCHSAGWIIHSFVLMDNHYHLLVETQRPTLVKGMQYLNSTYTQRYNVRHKTRGHLFQGRYKAVLVDPDNRGYFLTVSDYIHLNPVRVRRVKTLSSLLRDPWNSAGWLAGVRPKRPSWLSWKRVYGELGLRVWRETARKVFQNHLSQAMSHARKEPETWQVIRRGWCLGTEEFQKEMKTRLVERGEVGHDDESWSGPAVEVLEAERAQKLLIKGARQLGYRRVEEVIGQDRFVLAKWVRGQTKVSVKWLAGALGMKTRGGMSSGIYLMTQALLRDSSLQQRWRELMK